ncbi:MAG: ferritin-like domain-containing protein [Clostridia bacterium]|nr:ferritin-like domain-containing protein [Clostridia bacterium]
MGNTHDIHITKGYASPLPYPEIQVEGKNKYYAELLMDDYSGFASELTATNQYIYHNFVIKNCDAEIAEMLERVAIVEMMHMEMLSKLIILLGGNPIFRCPNFSNKKLKCWNSSFVYYGNNICDQLKADLKSEFDAIELYKKHIEIINDVYVQRVLERIILDEQLHVELFKKAIDKVCS